MFESITHFPGPLLYASGLLIVGLHVFYLSTRRSPWPGAIVPTVWLVVLTVLVFHNRVDRWWPVALVTIGLLVTWGVGRTHTSQPQNREAGRTVGH